MQCLVLCRLKAKLMVAVVLLWDLLVGRLSLVAFNLF